MRSTSFTGLFRNMAAGALIVVGAACGGQAPASIDARTDAPDFGRDVRPILAGRCFKCHGPDEASRQGGARFDLRDAATSLLKSGSAAVVAGDARASEMIARVSSKDAEKRMPPPSAGDPLSAAQIATLRRWIDSGAPYAEHWAYGPIGTPTPPEGPFVARPRDELDRFVLEKLRIEGIEPAPEAGKGTLLRRVSLDLIGLPPTPDEIDEFFADSSPAAYERVVDRLLASPHFGEHFARWWSDLARYADTRGYEKDERRTVWPWRDWVVNAFNADMPMDRFALVQLAGDLLPDATDDDRLATAFHRHTMTNDEGGTDDEEFRVAAVVDRVNTTGEVFLGHTVGCAQCHAHKYDALSHVDYYRLFAVFDQTEDADSLDDAPTMAIGAAPPGGKAPEVPILRELPASRRRESRRFIRGSFLNPGERVLPGVPAAWAAASGSSPDVAVDRAELARWIFSPKNPLTPRVMANRLFERVFGVGIVETVEDFGVQGTPPSHPELLDFLAARLRDGGWSVKRFVRGLVLSTTYRRSSNASLSERARDPQNRLLGRSSRLRLDGEQIRDQALAVSGLLSRRLGGPPVFPPQPTGLWKIIYSGDDWVGSTGEDRYRRALYTFWRRTVPYPVFQTFDAPARDVCVSRRTRTNTPLQAFVTLNDPAFVEAARALARRVIGETRGGSEARVARLFKLVLARAPTADETARFVAFAEAETATFRKDLEAAYSAASDPLGPASPETDPAELAAWTRAAAAALNLDEALTRE